jgi:hypothetical protein
MNTVAILFIVSMTGQVQTQFVFDLFQTAALCEQYRATNPIITALPPEQQTVCVTRNVMRVR